MAVTGTTAAELLIDIDSTIRVMVGVNTITPTTHSALLDNIVKVLSGMTTTDRNDYYTIDYNGVVVTPISDPIGIIAPSHNDAKNQDARITAPYLFQAFGQTQNTITGTTVVNFYDNMLFEVIEETGSASTITSDLQFDSYTGLSAYLTANLESTTADTVANKFSVKMYANVDKSLQKIEKVRGINTFLSAIKGRGSYWRKSIDVAGKSRKLNCAWVASQSVSYDLPDMMDNFLDAIYNKFLGINPTALSRADMMRTVWFNQDPKKFYNLYPAGSSISGGGYPDSSQERRMFNTGTNNFDAGQPTEQMVTNKIFMMGDDGRVYYTAGRNIASGLRYWDSVSSIERTVTPLTPNALKVPVITQMGTDKDGLPVNIVSAIRVYQLSDGIDRNCFMIKPMGVDTLIVDYIEDNTDAVLYGVLSSINNGKQVIVKFSDESKADNKTGNAGWRVKLNEYELLTLDKVTPNANFNPKKYGWELGSINGKSHFRNIRFFYGYPDGTVSQVSDDEVYHIVNSRGVQVKRLVRKNPIN